MPVDLMIVDLLLPHLDGRQLIRRARKSEQWSPIPIIVLSGYADLDRYRDLPVDALMTKPFELRDLLSKVRQLIGPSGTDSSLDGEDFPRQRPPIT
jgi:DNA-binding response OmpR family regulator